MVANYLKINIYQSPYLKLSQIIMVLFPTYFSSLILYVSEETVLTIMILSYLYVSLITMLKYAMKE